jgi:hypothetical protein
MQELTMNQYKNSMNGVTVHPVPLFASSWVALFCFLRNSLAKGRDETVNEADEQHTEGVETRH